MKNSVLFRDHPIDALLSPIITEKTSMLPGENYKAFRVHKEATKTLLKKLLEEVFSVKVEKIAIINQSGKIKRTKATKGKRADFKKAIVKFSPNKNLEYPGN